MISGLHVKIDGLKQLQSSFKKAGERVEPLTRDGMVSATGLIKRRAQGNLYRGHGLRTGTLRRSIYTQIFNKGLSGLIGVGEKYAAAIEFGSKPHTIFPRTRKALAFKIGGVTVFAKSVRHPGNREIPYMRPALDESLGDIEKIFTMVIDKIVKTMGGR